MNPVRLLQVFALTGLLSAVTAGCAVEDVGDEEVSESEDKLLEGRRLSPTEVATHLRAAGFPESEIGRMVCTAKYESSFYSRASNRNKNGSIDRGLFQINSVNLTGRSGCPTRGNYAELWDPAANARCAYGIFQSQGNRAWYGYRKHKTECDNYAAPGVALSDDANDTTDPASGGHGDEAEGGCWSATLEDMLDARSCVQSKSNGVWYQCMDGGWYRGGDEATGPFGACQGSHPL